MISLGGIELNNSMVWVNRYSGTLVQAVERRSLGGRLVVHAAQLIAGQPITLEATESYGWLSRSTVASILALAEDPLGVHTLVFGAQTLQVMFRHSEPPAVDFYPLIPRTEDEDGDYCIGTLKLLTI